MRVLFSLMISSLILSAPLYGASLDSIESERKEHGQQEEDNQTGVFKWVRANPRKIIAAAALLIVSGYFLTQKSKPWDVKISGAIDPAKLSETEAEAMDSSFWSSLADRVKRIYNNETPWVDLNEDMSIPETAPSFTRTPANELPTLPRNWYTGKISAFVRNQRSKDLSAWIKNQRKNPGSFKFHELATE